MIFDLTDDQRALVDTVEKLAGSAAAKRPHSASAEAAAAGMRARWQQMAELRLGGIVIAEKDGRIGMTMTETILVCEGLGQSLVQEPFITAAVVAPKLTERCTAAAVRSAQLRAIGESSVRIALACDETILDFDPARLLSRAEEHGGAFRISGAKELVIDGATATHFVVTAQHAGRGPNAFHVAPSQPGVTITPVRRLDGGWLSRVAFDAIEVEEPLFESEKSMTHIERALDHGIVALCTEAIGLMNRMLALTARYLLTRHQFGKAIGSFQALQHRFAKMVVAAEQSRSATYMAATAPTDDDAQTRKMEVSAAKPLVCRNGRAVLEASIQLHGGIGTTDEYELSRYVRRMLAIEKSWGDAIDHEKIGRLAG